MERCDYIYMRMNIFSSFNKLLIFYTYIYYILINDVRAYCVTDVCVRVCMCVDYADDDL